MGGAPPQFGPGSEGPGATPPPPDLGQEAQLTAAGYKAAGWWERFWAAYHASRAKGHGYFMSTAIPAVEMGLILLVEFITELQGKDNPEFYGLVSALLSDLLGVPVDTEVIKNAFIKGGDVGGARAVGAAFVKQLSGEFGANLNFETDARLRPALTFLGFLISFSIRIGNVTLLTGLIPEIHADDIREYGEQMATNLGLGRLARRALGPFIDDLVGKPMQDALRAQLRGTDLAAPEAIRSFNRGVIDQATFEKTMANLGYPDPIRDALVQEYLSHLNPDELATLLRWGLITSDDATARLKLLGYNEQTAADLITAHNHQRADTAISDYLTTLRDQAKNHNIDPDTFARLVGQLPIPEEVRFWQRAIAATHWEYPSHRLTLAQMTKYYAEALIDLTDFTDWAAAEGYSDRDTQLLVYDLLLNTKIEADKLKLQPTILYLRYLALKRKAEKEGAPPPPEIRHP